MEEAKAAAYFEELTRRGEGAARFKQGLGFSSSSTPSSTPKPSSSASPFFNFVRANSPGKAERQAQLEAIQAKLRRSQCSPSPDFRSSDFRCRSRERDGHAHRHSSSSEIRRERDRDYRSRGREKIRRSRSSSEEVEDREGFLHNRNGRRGKDSSRQGRRSRSPSCISSGRDLKRDHRRDVRCSAHGVSGKRVEKLDHAHLIKGYLQMTPAERVKAKMKLQLSQTAAKDSAMGMTQGWERFDFNKDAPLDDDNDEMEAAVDDASVVKKIGSSFRFSAVQAKREEEIKAAHDEAMFGALVIAPTVPESDTNGVEVKDDNEKQDSSLLISDKVLAMQQGSWRDRTGRSAF